MVKHDFPVYTFLCRYNCNIDYDKFILTINTENEVITLPIQNETFRIAYVEIPPRSEVILPFNLDIEEDSVICSREIGQGVFLANAIVPKVGIQHIRLLNALEETAIVRNLKVETVPLKNYDIYKANGNKADQDEERFGKLLKELNMENGNNSERSELLEILREYQSIFHLEGERLTTNNFYSQTIHLNDTSPVYMKNYRLPHTHTGEINNQVKGLLKQGIVEPSLGPYNATLLLVPKKGQSDLGKWRLVVDFRKLNEKIVSDKFPLTRLDDILYKLGRAKYFST